MGKPEHKRKVMSFVAGFSLLLSVSVMADDYFRMSGWVAVMNPSPVSSMNNEFSFGETCLISKIGRIRYLREGLAEYITERSAGTLCPLGTIFETTLEELKQSTKELESEKDPNDKKRLEICKKLGISCSDN